MEILTTVILLIVENKKGGPLFIRSLVINRAIVYTENIPKYLSSTNDAVINNWIPAFAGMTNKCGIIQFCDFITIELLQIQIP